MSGSEEVKLLGSHASPFTSRIEMALRIKGVPYEFVEEDIFNKSPLLLRLNPVHKKIPVLVHNGRAVAESLVILEYIEDTWKESPILPENPSGKAVARFWAKFLDDLCLPALWKAIWSGAEEREAAVEEASGHLKTLENELRDKGSKFFGGDSVGFVDIVACFLGFWLPILEEAVGLKILTEDKYPLLSEWVREFADLDINKEILNPGLKELLLGFFKARFHAMMTSSN